MKNALLIFILAFAACTPLTTTCPPCVCPCDSTVVVVPPDTTANGFILGVNANIWHPKDQQARMQSIRLYAPIGWAWTSKGFYGQPILQGQKQFLGLDDYLTFMKSKDVDVLLCLMQSPGFINGHEGLSNEWPPVRPGADKNDPKSYAEIASIYKAFAIRYGSKVWPKGSYKLDDSPPRWTGDPAQEYKSGLDLVKVIEVGNEVDIWWAPEKALTAEQHAIMQMVVYDSIKAYQPDMGVIIAGQTNYDLPRLKRMAAKFTALGRPFLSQAINVHHYQSTGNLPGVHPPQWPINGGCDWSEDKDFSTASQVVSWAKSIGLPCYITETGFDTQPGSQMYPHTLNGKTAEQIQAEWLVSTVLEYKRIGFERVYLFAMADEPNPNAGTFTSSGLLYGESTGYKEKPAMKAAADLCQQFKQKK